MAEKKYIAIDLKSFYASVECVVRGLDPLKAKLVVADESRTDKTICLAVSPALKSLGIAGRARLFEVKKIAKNENFIIAPPRMAKYLEVSKEILKIYTSFVALEDIHPYSIDEVFMDITSYLKTYNMTAEELARKIINTVLEKTGITATAGIGTNLYLAKIAMDIVAKHMEPDKNGVRLAELNEESFRRQLWNHEPLTDFWRIGRGTARRLSDLGIHTMGDLANYSLTGSEKLYRAFGINAELLIDHAWGWEPVEIKDIKRYESKNHSLCSGQVLPKPYNFTQAELIIKEMADNLALDLTSKNLETDQLIISIQYDSSNINPEFSGAIAKDFYHRVVPKPAHGSISFEDYTSSSREIMKKAVELFKKITDKSLKIRKIYLTANHVLPFGTRKTRQINLFSDIQKETENKKKDKQLQETTLKIRQRYGKNAILKAINLEKDATMRTRNMQIGGHKA